MRPRARCNLSPVAVFSRQLIVHMKTSLTLLVIAAVAAFTVVLFNVVVAASALFALGLYGLVAGDYSKARSAAGDVRHARSLAGRTERLSLAA